MLAAVCSELYKKTSSAGNKNQTKSGLKRIVCETSDIPAKIHQAMCINFLYHVLLPG
jgi:hypothetical protein